MHLFDPGVIGDIPLAVQIEGVLHLPGRMVLGLEEGIEVPEAGLNDRPLDLDKSHLQHDLPHVIDQSLVGMPFSRKNPIGRERDVIGARAID